MNRLTLSLSGQDVVILTSVLKSILGGTDIRELKSELRSDYLVFSCLTEFFNKLDNKNRELVITGYRPGKKIKIAMKLHEALAFHFLCTESEYPDSRTFHFPVVPDPTMALIRNIHAEIHKKFLL